MESIVALGNAADRLAEVCEAVLYGRRSVEPISKVVHVAFRDLTVTPPDMAIQLGRMK